MSKGRHRRPRPARHIPVALWTRALIGRFSRRRAQALSIPATQYPELTMADVIAAATTTYEVVEPCPWGLSAGACAAFHPSDHVNRFAELEPA